MGIAPGQDHGDANTGAHGVDEGDGSIPDSSGTSAAHAAKVTALNASLQLRNERSKPRSTAFGNTRVARAWGDDEDGTAHVQREDASTVEDEAADDGDRDDALSPAAEGAPVADRDSQSMVKKGALKKVDHSAMAGKENAPARANGYGTSGAVDDKQQDAHAATRWTSNVEKWQHHDSENVLTPRGGGKRKQVQAKSDGAGNQPARVVLRPLASSAPLAQPVRQHACDNAQHDDNDDVLAFSGPRNVAIQMEPFAQQVQLPPTHPATATAHKLKPSTSVKSSAMRLMERSPLLRPLSSIENDPEWGFRDLVESGPNVREEFVSLCVLSYPVIFTYVLEFLPGIVSMTLVGHMSSPKTKEYVDGVSLSTMFMNLTGVAFGFGLATAMDTLCSQAYGAGKPMKMGIYFQCGVLVLGFTVIPVFLLNWYTEQFLLWMGQPEEVAMLAGRFSRLILPGIPFLYVYELFKKLLQAQNIVTPMVYIAVLSNVVNIVLGVYLTWYTSWGYDGAAIARIVANVVLPGALVPFFMWNPHIVRQWWPGWKLSQAIRHLKTFLTLGIPGMFMMLLEWWAFEIMAAFVGLLPNSVVAISVHSVLANVSTMTFNFFLGIAVATNIRVGNYVGSNQPEHAKMASALGMVLALAVSMALAFVVLVTRNYLPMVFINDATSITLAAHAFLFLMPYQMLDAINSVTQGVFRGTGRQKLGAYINLFGYFAIGLPFGVFLAFQCDYGVEGLWLGLTTGIGVGVVMSLYKIYDINWDDMTDAARVRTS